MSKEAYEKLLDQLKLGLQRKFTKDQLASLLAGYLVSTEMYADRWGFPQGMTDYHDNAKNLVGVRSADLIPTETETP